MLTTESLDIVKHCRRFCRLIHFFRLSDEQRHRRETMLICAAFVDEHDTTRISRVSSTETTDSASSISDCICTRRLRIARMYEHKHEWNVASWRESEKSRRIERWKNRRSSSLFRNRMILRWKTSRLREYSIFRQDMLSSCSRDRYVWWQRHQLVANNVRSYSIFTMFSLDSYDFRRQIRRNISFFMSRNHRL